MSSPIPKTPKPARLALYWLGIQTVWGALLAISLQARSTELVAINALVAYGILATSGAIVAAVVQVVAGVLSDRRRRTTSDRIAYYLGGGIVGAIGIGWFYLAPSFPQLVGAYAIVQFGLNIAMAAYQPIIPDVVEPSATGVASSWMATLQLLGNAIGAIVASLIADARIVAGAIVALLLATCWGTAAHVRGLPLREVDGAAASEVPKGAFLNLFGSRALVYVGFFTLIGYLLFYVKTNAPTADLPAVTATSGYMVLAFTLAGAVGATLAAKPSDRWDKRAVASFGGTGVILALLVLIATHDVRIAFVATAFAGAFWGVFLVADWALGCRVVPATALATSMAVWNLAIVIPQIIAPLMTSVAIKTDFGALGGLDGPRLAFSLASLEILIGLLWIWRLPSVIARNNARSVRI
jgi:MFS family permease